MIITPATLRVQTSVYYYSYIRSLQLSSVLQLQLGDQQQRSQIISSQSILSRSRQYLFLFFLYSEQSSLTLYKVTIIIPEVGCSGPLLIINKYIYNVLLQLSYKLVIAKLFNYKDLFISLYVFILNLFNLVFQVLFQSIIFLYSDRLQRLVSYTL